MNTTVKITTFGSEDVKFEFISRATTAQHMYDIMRQSNTEQECGGEFNSLQDKIDSFLTINGCYFGLNVEFFPGISDVFFCIKGAINLDKNRTNNLDITTMLGEEILGTVLLEIRNHFGFTGWSTKLNSETSTHHGFKDLQVFKH
jgi:hypothetical protein